MLPVVLFWLIRQVAVADLVVKPEFKDLQITKKPLGKISKGFFSESFGELKSKL